MEQTASPDPFAIASLEALARHYEAPSERALKKVAPRLDDTARNFIAASPFCILTTIGHNGPHATPRGDAPRPTGVPTAGEMIASHTGGMVDSAAYDATAPARLAETLY